VFLIARDMSVYKRAIFVSASIASSRLGLSAVVSQNQPLILSYFASPTFLTMYLTVLLFSLTTLAVAAPLDKSIASPVKRETTQPVVQDYASYGNYYISYGDYPSAEDAKAAAMALSKHGYSCYTSYTPYPGSIDTESESSSMMEKRGYGTYAPYCVYGAAAEAEAAKMMAAEEDTAPHEGKHAYMPYYPATVEAEASEMTDANIAKRHVTMAMPKEMMHDAKDADMMEKQDMAVDMETVDTEHTATNDHYKSYE
jgi:hypothetical protein